MKTLIISITILFINITSLAQKNRISLSSNFGLNGNFFVRSYDEQGGPSINRTYLYNKNFIGSIAGIDLKYKIKSGELVLGYSRSTNKAKRNYSGNLNGIDVIVRDFKISHTNNFYHLLYEGRLSKNSPNLNYNIGLFYVSSQQQEISIENFANFINIDERNFKNAGLEEGGILAGIEYVKKIDNKFELGFRLRIYYLASVSTLEAITFTPTLTYKF